MFFISLLLVGAASLFAQGFLAIRNVTVLPMTGQAQLADQTVIISGGRIRFVGSAGAAEIPADATVIDGSGKFLMPGLIDAYAHIHEENLALFVAHGITTVRNAPGMIYQLALRDAVRKGELLGPRIFSSGAPLASDPPVYHSQATLSGEDDVVTAIRETKALGYDAGFVYVTTSKEEYPLILQKASEFALPIQGHLPYRVPLEVCANGVQSSFDNLVGLMNIQTGQTYPKPRLQEIGAALKKDRRVVIPTLTIHKARAASGNMDSLVNRSVMRYVVPRQRAYWELPRLSFDYGGASLIAKTFYEQGIQLLIGTDAGFPFVVAGSSYVDEIQNFKELGIPDYDILQAATLRAAEYLGLQEEIGSIEVGKSADLLLLNQNPMNDATNVRSVSGVCLRGMWYGPSELRALLEERAKRYAAMDSDRFEGFDRPSDGYRLIRHYEILYNSRVVGEEKIYAGGPADDHLLSLNSIDPHCSRKTTVEWIGGRTVRFRRIGVEGESQLVLKRTKSNLTVSGKVPYYGDVSWEEPVEDGVVLGGPPTSINLDMDIIATYQRIVRSVVDLETGHSDSIMVMRPELNSEEWGREAIVGKTYYKVTRSPDEGELRVYRVYQPGLNGHPGFGFKSMIKVDKEGWIDTINFNEKVNVRRKL